MIVGTQKAPTMKEKVTIIVFAVVIGIILTTGGFFAYQYIQRPRVKEEIKPITTKILGATPTPVSTIPLLIDEPKNESVFNKRTIQVKGKTDAENTIIVSSNSEDTVGVPSNDGSFSITISIDTGINKIITRAVSPTGEEVTDTRLVTYTSEEF